MVRVGGGGGGGEGVWGGKGGGWEGGCGRGHCSRHAGLVCAVGEIDVCARRCAKEAPQVVPQLLVGWEGEGGMVPCCYTMLDEV